MNIRSWLCASTLKANVIAKASAVSADVAHFDLEDSVPAHQKREAREALARHLQDPPCMTTAVRVNALSTIDGLKDLVFFVEEGLTPDIVILPKASVSAVTMAASVLGDALPHVKLFAIVENVKALCELRGLESAPKGLGGIIFGSADFAEDFGVDLHSANFLFVKQELALIGRRLDVPVIDSPCFGFHDEAALDRELREVVGLGFAGKIAIHPSQVAAINELFTPSAASVEHAHRLVSAEAQSSGGAILEVGRQMVGPPFLKRARHVLSTAARFAERVPEAPRSETRLSEIRVAQKRVARSK